MPPVGVERLRRRRDDARRRDAPLGAPIVEDGRRFPQGVVEALRGVGVPIHCRNNIIAWRRRVVVALVGSEVHVAERRLHRALEDLLARFLAPHVENLARPVAKAHDRRVALVVLHELDDVADAVAAEPAERRDDQFVELPRRELVGEERVVAIQGQKLEEHGPRHQTINAVAVVRWLQTNTNQSLRRREHRRKHRHARPAPSRRRCACGANEPVPLDKMNLRRGQTRRARPGPASAAASRSCAALSASGPRSASSSSSARPSPILVRISSSRVPVSIARAIRSSRRRPRSRAGSVTKFASTSPKFASFAAKSACTKSAASSSKIS